MNQEQWSRVERDQSALKQEKVSVANGEKKASVHKETDTVSVTKPKIVISEVHTL